MPVGQPVPSIVSNAWNTVGDSPSLIAGLSSVYNAPTGTYYYDPASGQASAATAAQIAANQNIYSTNYQSSSNSSGTPENGSSSSNSTFSEWPGSGQMPTLNPVGPGGSFLPSVAGNTTVGGSSGGTPVSQLGNIGGSTPSSLSSLGTALGGSTSNPIQTYADLYAQGMQNSLNYGATEQAQLSNSYAQQQASQAQSLQARGLGNATIVNSVMSGLGQAQNLAQTNLAEQIGEYKNDVISKLGLPLANAELGIYQQNSSQNAAMQQEVAQINANAALQQQQIGAAMQQQTNQFNYATALAAQQYGYNSSLQSQQIGLQNQYQTQLLKLQSQLSAAGQQHSYFANPLAAAGYSGSFI